MPRPARVNGNMERRPTPGPVTRAVAFNGGRIGVWWVGRGRADTGRELWRRSLGGSTKSSPISFTVDGRQVVVVAAGRALFEFGLQASFVARI